MDYTFDDYRQFSRSNLWFYFVVRGFVNRIGLKRWLKVSSPFVLILIVGFAAWFGQMIYALAHLPVAVYIVH